MEESITAAERDKILALCAGIMNPVVRARLMAKVNAPAYKARIDRLTAIEVSAQAWLAIAAPDQIKSMDEGLAVAGKDMYDRTMFDLQRGTGQGFGFAHVTDRDVEAVMHHRWSGKHYSERVWRNTELVAERVSVTVAQNVITGRSWRRSLNEVEDQALIDSTYAASRILRTETAYVANEMEAEAYEEAGLDEYQFVSTLDMRTSAICQSLDGKKFPLAKRQTGVNYPPMHPNCRSTTIAIIDGFDMTELQRRSRNPDTGETELVPANMTYPEWKSKREMSQGNEGFVRVDEKPNQPQQDGKLHSGKYASAPSQMHMVSLGDKDRGIMASDKQLGKKTGKHCSDYGLDPSSKEDREKFKKITEDIIDNHDSRHTGKWPGQAGDCTIYVKGEDVVIVDKDNKYVTTLKGGTGNAKIKDITQGRGEKV